MATRHQNERLFGQWEELPSGGRRYTKQIAGRLSGFARYCEEVDSAEETTHFWQEIYDRNGRLVARHEKFPVDSGHQGV